MGNETYVKTENSLPKLSGWYVMYDGIAIGHVELDCCGGALWYTVT
jgi:hypothetical protein